MDKRKLHAVLFHLVLPVRFDHLEESWKNSLQSVRFLSFLLKIFARHLFFIFFCLRVNKTVKTYTARITCRFVFSI